MVVDSGKEVKLVFWTTDSAVKTPPIRSGGRRIDALVFACISFSYNEVASAPKFGFHFVRGGLRNC